MPGIVPPTVKVCSKFILRKMVIAAFLLSASNRGAVRNSISSIYRRGKNSKKHVTVGVIYRSGTDDAIVKVKSNSPSTGVRGTTARRNRSWPATNPVK